MEQDGIGRTVGVAMVSASLAGLGAFLLFRTGSASSAQPSRSYRLPVTNGTIGPAESARPVASPPAPASAPAVTANAGSAPSITAGVPAPDGGAQSTAAFDRAVVAALDPTLPGTLESFDVLRSCALQDAARVLATVNRYKESYASWMDAKVAAGRLSQARAKASRDILAGFAVGGQAVQAAVSIVQAATSIPIVGQVIGQCLQIAQIWGQAAAEAASQGRSLLDAPALTDAGPPVFAGYRGGEYFFWDIPVLSFTAPMWATEFRISGANAAWGPGLDSLKRLAVARPFGCDAVVAVTIETGGDYTYQFSTSLGLRTVSVWNPDDVTPLGPRGYDVSSPQSWKVPGLKRSWYDIPGMVPVPWANLYWASYLVALQDSAAGNQLLQNNSQNIDVAQGVLDGLTRTPARDPKGYVPLPGQVPAAVNLPQKVG